MRKAILGTTLATLIGCSTSQIREEDYHLTEPPVASIQYDGQGIEKVIILDNGRQRGRLYKAILKDNKTINIHSTIIKYYIPIELGNHNLQIEITDKEGNTYSYNRNFKQN